MASVRVALARIGPPIFVNFINVHRQQHSFPTRRSSDLLAQVRRGVEKHPGFAVAADRERGLRARHIARLAGAYRSEEHTSELQSRRELVCRLLLEKKKEFARMGQHSLVNLIKMAQLQGK